MVGGERTPLLEGALGDHPGKPTVDDHADQGRECIEAWQPGAEGPCRVLPRERSFIAEQFDEHVVGGLVEHLSESVDGGNRGQLISTLTGCQRGFREKPHSTRAAITVGGDCEVVSTANTGKQGRSCAQSIE